MTLSQFLDNFLANIFKKRLGGVKIKVSIFMEVTKSVTSLYGFLLPPVCGDYPFWVLYSLLVGLPFLGVGLVYPENVGHQLQRAVATDRGWSSTSKTTM